MTNYTYLLLGVLFKLNISATSTSTLLKGGLTSPILDRYEQRLYAVKSKKPLPNVRYNPAKYPKACQELVAVDYAHKLNEKEKRWLACFNEVHYGSNPVHLEEITGTPPTLEEKRKSYREAQHTKRSYQADALSPFRRCSEHTYGPSNDKLTDEASCDRDNGFTARYEKKDVLTDAPGTGHSKHRQPKKKSSS